MVTRLLAESAGDGPAKLRLGRQHQSKHHNELFLPHPKIQPEAHTASKRTAMVHLR